MGKVNVKKSYEEVYEFYKNRGLELLDGKYINVKTKMECIDGDEYRVFVSYDNLNQGKNPSRFGNGNPHTIENIKLYIKLNRENVELVSTEYVNNSSKLIFKCLIHREEFHMSWNMFKSNYGCAICGGKQKLSIEIIKQRITDTGRGKEVELISTEYVNNETKLKFLCKKHGEEFDMCWGNFQQGQGCPICRYEVSSSKKRHSIELIKQKMIDLGRDKEVELVSMVYIGTDEKLLFLCKKHNEIFEMSWSHFQASQGCPICAIDRRSGNNHPMKRLEVVSKVSGKNSYMWKQDKTYEEREIGRKYPEYHKFVKESLKLSNYTCDITGKRGCELAVHHLNGYHWFIEGRTDINNAVVLSKEVHDEFHLLYNNRNNTKEQYEAFKINKQIELGVVKEVV